MAEYRKRIADEIIKEKLSYMGAVLVRRYFLKLSEENPSSEGR